jgi:hypothetical protein
MKNIDKLHARAFKLKAVIVALGLYLFAATAHSASLFMDCEDIAGISSYRSLQKYISTKDEGNELCQRIDENEFLYTTHDNIYYCKAPQGAPLKCELNDKGHFLPELTVVRKFGGDNGRQFVLFRSRNIVQDIYAEVYFVFYLVPKNINPRGYEFFTLPSAGAADHNDGSAKCLNNNDADVITTSKSPLEILNENQSNVTIRFNQFRTSCKNKEKSRQTLEFTWQNGNYKQTKNLIEVVKDKR